MILHVRANPGLQRRVPLEHGAAWRARAEVPLDLDDARQVELPVEVSV
jgi:hypothetical protein